MPAIQTESTFRKMLMSSSLALALLASSCGGGNSTSDSSTTPPVSATATLVVVLAAPSPPVTVTVDGEALAQNLSYMTSTNPLIVPSGSHKLLLTNSAGSAEGPNQNGGIVTLDLQPQSHTTAVYIFPAVFGWADNILTDDTTPAPNSMAKLRIADFSSSDGSNVYLMPFGSTGPSGTPILTDSGSQQPVYQTVAPGNYDIFVQSPGNSSVPPTVIYHTGSFQLAANQNKTLYLLTTCQNSMTADACTPNGITSVTVTDLN